MKKILISLFFTVIFTFTSIGADAWFTWDKNPESELVGTYKMEYIKYPTITNWTYLTSVPGTTNVAVVKGIQGGYTYKFRVFASNTKGTGTNMSNIIEIPTNAPSAVTNFTLTTLK